MVNSVNFTLEDLARVTIEVADEQPDFRYNKNPGDGRWCAYAHGEKPGCIFGHSLQRLGVDIVKLPNTGIGTHLAQWFGGGALDEEAYVPFRQTQAAQDTGDSWGVAIGALRAAYPHLVNGADGGD